MARERIRTRIRVTEQPDTGFVPAEPAPAAPSGPRARWPWLVALGVVLLVVAGGVAIWSRMHAPARSPGPAPEGMVWIPAGTFWMGSPVLNLKDARPEHEVTLDGFWIDITEVTNAQFERFVNATQYKTSAELPFETADSSDAPIETLPPGSMVFMRASGKSTSDNPIDWWRRLAGADWRHPEGPESTIVGKENHPVVHVSWNDAAAYAEWAGKRLATEAEWEYAARGGLDRQQYCWGDKLKPNGKWQANVWQGRFPLANTGEDGFVGTAPVKSFPPNGYGLFDMAGNVWEWCQDWYSPDYYNLSPARNPLGPTTSFEPSNPELPRRVQRGGSYLCDDTHCRRFLPGARGRGDPNAGACHVGFRCVKSP